MIRRLRNKFLPEKKTNSNAGTGKRVRGFSERCSAVMTYDSLEARQMLAFSFGFVGGTLTLTQSADDGAITVDNNGAGDAFRTNDGSGLVTYVAATNLVVNLLDGTGNQLDFDLVNAHTGNVELNLGDGARMANFTGTSNAIGGDLTVNSGTDNQTVEIAVNNALSVGGSASFSLGTGFDIVDEDLNDITVATDWNMTDVNLFENGGTMNVGGNFVYDVSADDNGGEMDNDAIMNIAGDYTYTGGSMFDKSLTNADFNLTGNYMADLADGGGNFNINNANVNIDGTVTLIASSTAFADTVNTQVGATFGGDFVIDLGGGVNNANFRGTFNGDSVAYTGQDGVDTIVYNFSGNPADVSAMLGAGDDSFTLDPLASIAPTTLEIDFGDNSDTFVNNLGAFTFDTMLLGLMGFDYAYDSITDSLSATEVSNAGTVEFDNNGVSQAFRFNNGIVNLVPATNFSVTMLDDTAATLDIDLDFALAGNLMVDIGDGVRALNFIGFDNSIGGDLTVNAGADDQTLEIGVNNALTVGGNLLFDLGMGSDSVDEDNNNITVGGDFDFVGVNFFENGGTFSVGGSVTVDTTNEVEDTLFDDDATMTIAGDFTFTGGDGRDEITMNGVAAGTSVGGNVLMDVGDNTTGGNQFMFFNLPNSSVAGTLDVISTSATNLDSFALHPSGSYGGDINVDLGEGPNDAVFAGTFGGTDITYRGGSDIDNVSFGTTGNPANVNLLLGAGDDNFALNAGAVISPTTLRVDFGGGTDGFVNSFGSFNFNASFLNWDNFNRFYKLTNDQWNMTQLVDNGDVTLGVNGAGEVELIGAYLTTVPAADNVRINMLANSVSNVAVDLASPVAGNLNLDLSNGDRNVDFVGVSNSVVGNLRIEANTGDQNVDLAVNQPLTVGASTVINLREGIDVVDDDGNDLTFSNYLILRGVNQFETEGTVFANYMTMNTSFEVAPARLDNDGSFNILNNLLYIGGADKDDIFLNNGATVFGNARLDLGDNMNSLPPQSVNLVGFTGGGHVRVQGGDSTGGNSLLTDVTTSINGNFVVDFSANTSDNFAILDGTFAGNFGYYKGGSGDDMVTMDQISGDMDLFLNLGAGEDTLNLGNGTSLNYLFVNFGDDIDTFNDEFLGIYPFLTAFNNLP